MKIKTNLVKITAAAALTAVGVTGINAVKTSSVQHVQAAVWRIKVNYIPGYGVNIWSSYKNGHFTGKRAMHGETYEVLETKKDQDGNTWYKLDDHQWIEGRYAINAKSAKAKKVSANQAVKATGTISKPKKKKATKKTNLTITTQNQNSEATSKTSQVKKTSKQASSSAAAIVALAKAQVGKNYVWGGTTPAGFDCSGLTQYVYNNAAGIDISRTTYTQVNQGKAVSLNNLQPGDLLFWGSASAPYHVGIYVGNGQYVHAATPSEGVKMQALSGYFYPSTARRILK